MVKTRWLTHTCRNASPISLPSGAVGPGGSDSVPPPAPAPVPCMRVLGAPVRSRTAGSTGPGAAVAGVGVEVGWGEG